MSVRSTCVYSLALGSVAQVCLAQASFRPVALSGQPASGLPGVVLEYVSDPKVTPDGHAAFFARLAGDGVTLDNAEAILTDRSGSLALAWRSGLPAPGTAGTLGGFVSYALTPSGHLAFTAPIIESVAVVTPMGYFVETAPGVLALLTRETGTFIAPALPGLVPVNPEGHVAWAVDTFVETSQGLRVDTTTPVPGAADPFRRFSQPGLGSAGEVVFRAFHGTTTTGTDWRAGIFRASSSGLSVLARTGEPAPGFPAGVTYADLSGTPIISDSHGVYAWARVQGPFITNANDTGLFREASGALLPVVMSGDPVPGLDGVTFGAISKRFSITPSGGVAFLAQLANAPAESNTGIFVAEPTSPVRMIVRTGQRLFSMPAGSYLTGLGEPRVGPEGHLLFTATSRAGGTSGTVLCGGDTVATPTALVRSGASFYVPGAGMKQVRHVQFDHESELAGHSQFAGRSFAVTLMFEDRTHGVFIGDFTCTNDFNGDGDPGTDADIEAFFACVAGNCCETCASADFDGDGDIGTEADIEAFFRVLAGHPC
jgi:hypothetical protein